MSHNIKYYEYPRNVNKNSVKKNLDNFVAHEDWQEGCSGLYNPIRWLGDKIYSSEEEAHEAINKLDKGWYDNLAVLYEMAHEPKDDNVTALQKKVRDAHDEYVRRDSILYSQTVTSALIGCKKCGSRLVRTYLKTNKCPVCHEELRPEHMIKSVEAAKNKWDRSNRDLREYTKKHGKREIMWLVKIEYHT